MGMFERGNGPVFRVCVHEYAQPVAKTNAAGTLVLGQKYFCLHISQIESMRRIPIDNKLLILPDAHYPKGTRLGTGRLGTPGGLVGGKNARRIRQASLPQ